MLSKLRAIVRLDKHSINHGIIMICYFLVAIESGTIMFGVKPLLWSRHRSIEAGREASHGAAPAAVEPTARSVASVGRRGCGCGCYYRVVTVTVVKPVSGSSNLRSFARDSS